MSVVFEGLVAEHVGRGCSVAVARRAAYLRLHEAGLWDALMHPRARAGEFASKGGDLRRDVHTRSGKDIRVRPFENNREAYLHGLARSKPAKFSRKQIDQLKHIKNVLKDPGTPRNVKLELASGAMGVILGTAIPLIPGDEVISAGVISHALKRSRGEQALPLVQRAGQVTEPAVGLSGMMSPGTQQVGRSAPPTVHLHDYRRAGDASGAPKVPPSRRKFKPAFAGSRY